MTQPWAKGWLPLLFFPGSPILFAPSYWPRWAFMWVLAGAIYVGCKWLTWRRTPVEAAPGWKHLGYLLAWPGMDAVAFLRVAWHRRRRASLDGRPAEIGHSR